MFVSGGGGRGGECCYGGGVGEFEGGDAPCAGEDDEGEGERGGWGGEILYFACETYSDFDYRF